MRRDERMDARTAATHPENRAGFDARHPRRAEVLKRTDNQNSQVNRALTDKQLTYQQGAQIKAEDQSIRRQEQADAAANGGYITKQQQAQLNREENKVEGQIKADEAADAGQAH